MSREEKLGMWKQIEFRGSHHHEKRCSQRFELTRKSKCRAFYSDHLVSSPSGPHETVGVSVLRSTLSLLCSEKNWA